ncbi:MAG: VTC domain-containing protein [Bacteroidales bacterium]|nr:VTC domain-containing protein [Bacteroidales bacterium]
MMCVLDDLLQDFQTISLEEMKSVKLMNRVDSKYLVTLSQLPEILSQLKSDYLAQARNGKKYAHYQTLYYDTPDVQMYVAHQDGKLTRQKLRARIYCETQECFCEIKNKNNKKRTKKKRTQLPIEAYDNMLTNETARAFVTDKLHYHVENLMPQVENSFDRITLVNNQRTERLTIDSHIAFHNRVTGISNSIPELVIIELKQDGNCPSFFKKLLENMRIRPKRVSKYCLGTVLTRPDAKMNRYKRKLRYINRLINK